MTDTQTLEITADADIEDAIEAPIDAPVPFVDEYADATRYDHEYGTAGADLAFYQALGASAGRVLDVATGTGRIALSLAEAGHEVTAVDISAGMLEVAEAKDEAELVTWVEQDARELKVRGKFDLAILAGNALQQFI